MNKKTKDNVAYACAVMKRLVLAAVFCIAAVIDFNVETPFHKVMDIVLAAYFTAMFVRALMSRKNVDTEGHSVNLLFLLMYAASYYYYLTGEGLILVIGIVVYTALDLTAFRLTERKGKRLYFTSRTFFPKSMAVLAMVMFVISPLFHDDNPSLVRLAVYLVLILFPIFYYVLLSSKFWYEMEQTDAGKCLMGQGTSIICIFLSLLSINEDIGFPLVPTILFAVVSLSDFINSFILKKE